MKPNEPQDNIDSAFEILRTTPVPDGPSDDLVEKTRHALFAAEKESPRKQLWRTMLMRNRNPIAAAMLIAIGAAVAVIMLRSPGVTYADVIKKMSQAHLVRFEIEVSGSTRITTIDTDDGVEYIFLPNSKSVRSNKQGQRNLYVDTKARTAQLYVYPAAEVKPRTLLQSFRDMVDKPSKDMGPEEFMGHHAEKFVVEHPDNLEMTAVMNASGNVTDTKLVVKPETWTLWADAQSGDLLHVEQVVGTGNDARKSVYDNFVIDPAVSADDLSMEAPAGYELSISGQSIMSPSQLEKAMIQSLRDYAAGHDGKFPPDLSALPADLAFTGPSKDFEAASGIVRTQPTTHPFSGVGMHALVMLSTTAPSIVTSESKAEPDSKIVWGWCYYVGKTMGDGSSLVFWYKAGIHGGHYRGIYSDLSAKDLTKIPAN